MELSKFIQSYGEKLNGVDFDAEEVFASAVAVGTMPEKAALALMEFVSKNPQVDLNLYRQPNQIINRYRLLPPGPAIEDFGPNKFFKFMFGLGIVIE